MPSFLKLVDLVEGSVKSLIETMVVRDLGYIITNCGPRFF